MLLMHTLFLVVEVAFEGDGTRFVNEEDTSIQVCLVLSHSDLEREITVTVAPREGSATGKP